MVGGEARSESFAVDSGPGQQLLDYYEPFMNYMPRSLRRRTGRTLSLHACQDIAQEAFLSVARRLQAGELDDDVNVRAYLATAAWNLARDRLRTHRRLDLVGNDLQAILPEQRDDDSPVHSVDVLEDLVWPAIEAMPPSQRRQVVDLQSRGMTDLEIATVLGMRADQIHRDRHKAVVALRQALAKFIRDQHRSKNRCVKKDGGRV
ncbi:RNA polymerase sigma factor [Streptomyces sp. NBC_01304]|uniref:RNA polymerase sigma factor n=1 Tax=Streptomyces sp. NBC_01304 TaxID=2903818 RepID=UPI002E1293AC|nr:sigma-70 family RNA polymerase sigma factor [Streptomyces sp. NBC_01304]